MAYQQLKGTGVALVTPFLKNGSVDYPSLEKIVTHTIKGGVDFLVALGTTAETPTLTGQEKQELLAAIVRFANGEVPIICGIGGNNTTEVLQQLKEYDLSGVAAIMSVTPYYNKPTQEGLYQHFKAIANATELAIVLYNVPGRTGCNMLPATAIRLANEFKNIIAVKEASGNMAQCLELIQNKPDHLTVLSGDDDLTLAHMAIGMEGVISVAANCFTKEITDIINLSIVGKFDKARKVFYRILPAINLLFADGNPAGVKYILSQMDICENRLRLPLVPVSEGTAKKIVQYLKAE